MNAQGNQHLAKDAPVMSLTRDIKTLSPCDEKTPETGLTETPTQLYLRSNMLAQHKEAGLNPLVDAAGLIFSLIGKLKYQKTYRQLAKLQQELLQELDLFTDTIKPNYAPELVMVSRFVLAATIDDIFEHSAWGIEQQWEKYQILTATNQDQQHESKFFAVLKRALSEPKGYIDLMELMYIALSLGYKGQYRGTEHSQYQLDQVTDQLYKHIRAFRGGKETAIALIPAPKKAASTASIKGKKTISLPFVFFFTACITMSIFIGLGYLTDIYTNEAENSLQLAQLASSSNHQPASTQQ